MPFIPLHDKNPRVLVSQPWITWATILACAAVYLVQASTPPDELRLMILAYGAIPAAIVDHAALPPEIAQVPPLATLFTHQFLHGGLLHLLFNMAYLWVFGDNVEDAMGHVRFAVFFLVCGAVAALAQVAADPLATAPIIGASGAVSGILGAYLLLHPQARILVPIIIVPIYLPAYLLLLVWIGFQFYAVTHMPAVGQGVAWWAHIGGFLAGLVLVVPFRYKSVPLWRRGELPGGIELTVQDTRRERREEPEPGAGSSSRESDRKRGSGKRGPWG